jgi:CheY-like chemotaxis protein
MNRVLVVDDNETNRDLISRQLQRKGWQVLVAEDGTQALEMIRRELPDLILMDLGLPGLGGLEVIRILKEEKATLAIPVIALTAHAMQADRERSLAAGSDDFETKPIDFSSLLSKMETLVKEGRQARERGEAQELTT